MTQTVPFPGRDPEFSRIQPEAEAPRRPADAPTRIYTNEEVSEIVRVALRKAERKETNTVDHEEMLAIGRDFGLTEEDIAAAFADIGRARAMESQTGRAQLAFKVHAMVFVVVISGLFLINWMTTPDYWWAVYPLVISGTVLVLQGIATKYVPTLAARALEHAFQVSRELYSAQKWTPRETARAHFSIPELYGDLAEAKGLAQIRGRKLILEFEVVDSIFGAFRSKVREVAVPLEEIASVRLDRQLWASTLTIQGTRMKTLKSVPGSSGGQIKLVFARDAQAAVEQLAETLSETIPPR